MERNVLVPPRSPRYALYRYALLLELGIVYSLGEGHPLGQRAPRKRQTPERTPAQTTLPWTGGSDARLAAQTVAIDILPPEAYKGYGAFHKDIERIAVRHAGVLRRAVDDIARD